ncbi:MAG: DUF1565 domain-containing protein [Kastovskya adunca ATA6-11-RM4]|nr:DUF1565 domain-containing protein [Kastovskya adunca ATA6-11-RM4]
MRHPFRSGQSSVSVLPWRQYVMTYGMVLGLGVTLLEPIWLSTKAAANDAIPKASAPSLVAQLPAGANSSPAVDLLFVNPATGNDRSGNGSERSPLKTITQALSIAQPNTVILLAPGTYSSETGEVFPLRLQPRVTIQGVPRTRGQNIVIKGGGQVFVNYASGQAATSQQPPGSSQNVAILALHPSGLTGVTVTNPNPQGYGLWIESSASAIADNTFTGSGQDGIFVNGDSTPIIRSNYIDENGANGMTVAGTARPEVRENVFENTGIGMSIIENSAPQLLGNRISSNRYGVVVSANARPVLRNNLIADSQEDGLVISTTSRPDLGTAAVPGNNTFRGNRGTDINSQASESAIATLDNQPRPVSTPSPSVSPSTVASTPAPPPPDPTPTPAPQAAAPAQQPSSEAPLRIMSLRFPDTSQPSNAATPDSAPTQQPTSSISASSFPAPNSLKPQASSLSEPINELSFTAPSVGSRNPTPSASPTLQSDDIALDGGVEISVPTPTLSPQPPTPAPSNPVTTGDIDNTSALGSSLTSGLPVLAPSPLPGSNGQNAPVAPMPPVRDSNLPESPPKETSTALNSGTASNRYRVWVATENENQQNLVRSLIPGAFRSTANGRTVMQAGIFSDRVNAEEVLQLLSTKGLKGTIDEL